MPIDGKGKTDYDENKFILFSAREEPGARMENAREMCIRDRGALAVLLVVVGDGEAVGLLLDLADEGEDRLLPGDADLPALGGHEGTGAVAVVLHHAEDGDGTAEALSLIHI